MVALKLFSSLLFSFASAATLPQIPIDCFDEKNYCTKTTITGGLLQNKVISITFFAQVSADDYPTANSIMDLYLDFKRWPEYTASSNSIRYFVSADMSKSIENSSPKYHYARYDVQGPFPINRVLAREFTEYKKIVPAPPGSELSYSFSLVQGQHTDLPESLPKYQTLYNSEGTRQKNGEIHIQYDQQYHVYNLYLIVNCAPEIQILPQVAAPFMEAAMISVAKGMLGL